MKHALATLTLLLAAAHLAPGCASHPAGTFVCGDGDCRDADQYCVTTFDDMGGDTQYACEAIPAGCTDVCGCVGWSEWPGCCTLDAEGHATTTYPCP